MSFGQDPTVAAQQLNGVGVYSTPFCLAHNHATNGLGLKGTSNCGVTSAVDSAVNVGDPAVVMDLVNALELTWTLPYEVPNDRTEAVIVCKTQQAAGGSGAGAGASNHWTKDPLRILSSSVMTKGWGTGNCFYQGVLVGTPGQHTILCANTGKLAKSASL